MSWLPQTVKDWSSHVFCPASAVGLRLAAPGVSELVCHPGMGDADLSADYDWNYDWDAATAALCDPGIPELLPNEGIELTAFSRL